MSQISPKLRQATDGMLIFWCPGCDGAHGIPTGAGGGARWSYNGNADKPTFTPSVLVRSETWEPPVTHENHDDWKKAPWPQKKVATVCHSFVTDGRIQFLGDCTHVLAGQTVELPDWHTASEGF